MPTNINPNDCRAALLDACDLLYPIRCELSVLRRALRTLHPGEVPEEDCNGFAFVFASVEDNLAKIEAVLKGGLAV